MKLILGMCAVCGACAAVWLGGGGSAALSQDADTAAGSRAKGSRPAKVHLQKCRIQLPMNVLLASDRPGLIAFVGPEEGDTVRAGQLIARLRDEVAQANVETTKLLAEIDVEVRYAVAAHDFDSNKLERALDANKKLRNAIPELEVAEMELAKNRSQLQIEKAKHDLAVNGKKLKEAEAQLKTYQVEAPWDGVVTRVLKKKGEAVNQGDTILELVNTDRVRVEGDVDIKDVFTIRTGARVTVQLNIPDVELDVEEQTFEGRIGFVDVTVIPGTDKVRVWADVANHDNILRGGLIARMNIFPEDVVEKRDRKNPPPQSSNAGESGRN